MDPEYREMLLANLNVSKEMLSQRIYDLQIAENVSLLAKCSNDSYDAND